MISENILRLTRESQNLQKEILTEVGQSYRLAFPLILYNPSRKKSVPEKIPDLADLEIKLDQSQFVRKNSKIFLNQAIMVQLDHIPEKNLLGIAGRRKIGAFVTHETQTSIDPNKILRCSDQPSTMRRIRIGTNAPSSVASCPLEIKGPENRLKNDATPHISVHGGGKYHTELFYHNLEGTRQTGRLFP